MDNTGLSWTHMLPKTEHPGPPKTPPRSLWPVLVCSVVASVALHWILADKFARYEIRWDAWRHRPLAPWTWTPFIHPPPYGEYLRVMEAWSDSTGRNIVELFLKSSAVLAGGTVLAAGLLYRKVLDSPMLVSIGVALLAISPAGLRPFEQYPLATLLSTVSIGLMLHYCSKGKAASLVGAGGTGLMAISLHLSCWFVLGPLLVCLACTQPTRRGALLATAGAMVGLFLVGTVWPGPGMWPLFDHPHAYYSEDRPFGDFYWSDINLEWSNRWLLLPLLGWLHPRVRRASPVGLALTGALLTYILITSVLMASGLAIASDRVEAHHYFELVDPLLILTSLIALQMTGRALSLPRWIGSATLGVVVLSQVWAFGSGLGFLQRVAGCPWLWQDFHKVVTVGAAERSLGTKAGWIAVQHSHPPDDGLLDMVGRLELIVTAHGMEDLVVEADAAGYRGEFPRVGLEVGEEHLPLELRVSARAYDRGTGVLVAEASQGEPLTLGPGKILRVSVGRFTGIEP